MRRLTICGLVAVMTLGLVLGVRISGPVRVAEANPGTNWNGAYFDNASLSGSAKVNRVDNQISFNWGTGSPDPAIPADNFSARWTKTVNFPTSGSWTFKVGADDGVRMWIDVTPIIDQWHTGAYQVYEVTIDQLTAGNHDLKVEFFESVGDARIEVQWWFSGSSSTTVDWNASYYNNVNLDGIAVLTRVDHGINFDWGTGSPGSGVNADNFSARWKATVNFATAGRWRFKVGVDDGARMWIDVTQIINEWHGSATGYAEYEFDVYSLTAGNHDLTVEYFEVSGNARINVSWQLIEGMVGTTPVDGSGGGGGVTPQPTPIPPVVVYAAVTGDNVNVRTGPGMGYPALTQLYYPDDYLVVAGVPDLSWIKIRLDDGSEAWVSNEWVWLYSTDEEKNKDTTGGGQPDFVDFIPRVDIEVAPPALPPDEPPRRMLRGLATDTIRLRDGASLGAARIIGSVPQGAGFTVEARSANGAWYLINYRDIRGWVSALYVTLVDGFVRDLVVSSEVVPAPPLGSVFVPEEEPGVLVTVRGRAISNIRMRSAASLQGDQIASVPRDSEFVIEGRNSNGAWFLISWEGANGWVSALYVELIEGTVPDLPIR